MSFWQRLELWESSIWETKPSILRSSLGAVQMELDEQLDFTLDVLNPCHCRKSDLPVFPSFNYWSTDLASLPLFSAAVRQAEADLQLQSLSDRVAALELGFQRAIGARTVGRDRKYKWTADIKGPNGEESGKKYRVVADLKAGGERSVKWTSEVKGKGSYTFEASTALAASPAAAGNKKIKEDKKVFEKKKGPGTSTRVVEIEEEKNHGVVNIRKAFAKRPLFRSNVKRKELSPQDAAVIIQKSFRAYLVRRSQVIHSLRDLAISKAKLKEIRYLFNNLSYRRRLAMDAEELQRFTEKIIVLVLTVEAIQGSDCLVRAAKSSIISELEIKLEAVDPQPDKKLGSLKRRKFDLPKSNSIAHEMARGVAQVVEVIDEHSEHASLRASA